MARDYTPLPYEYLEEMDTLSDAEFGRLVRGLLEYCITGQEPPLSGNEKVHWKRVRNRETKYREAFEAADRTRSERGAKAAQARWANAQACASMPEHAQACTSIPSNAKHAYIGDRIGDDIGDRDGDGYGDNARARAREEDDDGFSAFWSAFPKKSGEIRGAYMEYIHALDTGATQEQLLEAVKWQSEEWKAEGDPRYIPSPEKWLKNRRWEEPRRERKAQKQEKKSPAYVSDGTGPGRVDNDELKKILDRI